MLESINDFVLSFRSRFKEVLAKSNEAIKYTMLLFGQAVFGISKNTMVPAI